MPSRDHWGLIMRKDDPLASHSSIHLHDLLYNASIMVREGIGSVLGLDGLIYTGEESDLCFRPLEPALLSPMYIIYRKYQVFTPVASLLLERLKERFG